MKLPEIVLYTVAGLQRYALVFGSNLAAIDHLGENEEPTLNLAFFAPEREPGSASARIGYEPTVYKAYDVVHASHEFSEEFKLKNGLQTPAQIASIRGAGEWTEVGEVIAVAEWLTNQPDVIARIEKFIGPRSTGTFGVAVRNDEIRLTGHQSAEDLMTLEQAKSLLAEQAKALNITDASKAVPLGEPSADDLDAVAEEDKAKEATSGEPAPSQESGDPWSEGKKTASDPASPTYPQIL